MAQRRRVEDVALFRPSQKDGAISKITAVSTYLRRDLNRMFFSVHDESVTLLIDGYWPWKFAESFELHRRLDGTTMQWLREEGDLDCSRSPIETHLAYERGDCLIAPRLGPLNPRYVRVVTLQPAKMLEGFAEWAEFQFPGDPYPVLPLLLGRECLVFCEDPDSRFRENKLTLARTYFG